MDQIKRLLKQDKYNYYVLAESNDSLVINVTLNKQYTIRVYPVYDRFNIFVDGIPIKFYGYNFDNEQEEYNYVECKMDFLKYMLDRLGDMKINEGFKGLSDSKLYTFLLILHLNGFRVELKSGSIFVYIYGFINPLIKMTGITENLIHINVASLRNYIADLYEYKKQLVIEERREVREKLKGNMNLQKQQVAN